MRLDPKKRLFLALLVAAVVPSLHSQDVEQVNVTDASIQGNVTWTADREYILNGFVFVEDGETLTIEPGTVVRGMPGEAESASALIVARGGTIMAEGTADAPIIFTALNDDVSDPTDFNGGDVGEWGGLILLGNAPLNSPEGSGTPITDNIEGIPESEPRGEFGGADPMDNSGVLRFVSVRHGGTNIGANNEINGVTFGGVGAGTTVEFVEVFANKDDGFEFFGGTVNTKFLIAAFVGDDSFDYDQGFTGKGQFWFSLGTGDRGGEHDGDVDDLNNLPLSNPTILNATYIGPGSDFDGSGDAVKLRENAAGKYFNSVFAHFPDRAIDVDSTLEDGAADPTANNIASGELDFRENIFFDFGRDAENNSSSAAQDLFSADRNNVFVDPEFEAYAPFGLTDPRPMVGSPALMAGSDEPTDGFFSDVSFKGAFGRENWVGGWTIAAESGLVSDMGASIPDYPLAQTVTQIQVTDASIDGDTVWTAGNEYILDGFVFVEDGEMLTIEAGTVIRGMPGEAESASALIVARGGKIMAEGTPEAPIIFTALNDDLSDPTDFSAGDVGEWGGLIVLGHAPLNSPEGSGTPITDNIEGIPESEPRGEFGGADPMDNSGVLRFVSVRHGGTNIGANNEINGVTFGGVGAGTTVEYIEVFANKDDGFEFFGGTVNTKFLVAAFVGDDSFDYDQGFTGKGQFWLSIGTGDRGGEHDGDVDDLNNLPLSNPTIFNATYIGPGSDFAGSGDAVKLRENAAGKYYNSVFAHFPDRAIDVDSTLEDGAADPTANNIASGELDFRENIFFDFGRDAENNSSSAAQALFSADRNNVFVDPMFSAFDPVGLTDPRPMAGSPALASGWAEPADGFFSDVDFKGAFGAANWSGGWTIAAQSGFLSNENPMIPDYPTLAEQMVVTDADIVGNTVWTNDKEYVLDGFVFVEDGETLTIEAGTVIRGMPGEAESASALIVARGGMIMAEGTPDAPIIFTALNDDIADTTDFNAGDVGEWGGLIILGHAPLNSPEGSGTPITDNIEGIPESEPRGEFGGADPMDNSGVLRFVSVRHGGTNIGANNEINGVTFGGVGAGTTVEYIEVFANKDDGFEFFGGTVNTKFLIAAYVGDDSFDYDQGFTGKGQFWLSIGTGDRGGEHDGDVDDLNNLPLSNPTIFNVSYIGPGSDFEGSGDAVKLRENAAGKYFNSIFAHFPDRAIDVDSTLEDGTADPTANNIASGELDFRDNIFFDFGRDAANNSSSAAQALFSADRNNVFVDPMFGAYTPFGLIDPVPMAGSPAMEAGSDEPADGFFSDVSFKGAFGAANWAGGWSIAAQSGLLSNEAPMIPDYPLAEGVTQVQITDASIEGDTVWTAGNEYILDGFVFVEDGETLTIEAGAVIRGMPGEAESASALIVARGGKIMAEGTAQAPIIFTALNDDLSDPTDFSAGDVGEWGGLIVLGHAPLNSPEGSGTPITDNIEGIPESEPRGEFGGADPMDNSGVLRFVSVRHGGTNIGANNEINGVTFGGVGAGTTVEYIEVFANKDDGFEFFGGTVNTKWLVAAFVGDDSFDYDQGYTGKGQFWFSLGTGDRGGEHDGDVDDLNNLPLSNPTILNATYIGPGSDFDGSGDAVKLRENAAGKYYNSIFAHFPDRAIDVDSTLEDGSADPTANNIASGELDFRENIFFDFGRDAENNSSSAAQALFSADRNNVFVDPMFTAYTPFGLTDPRPMAGSPALEAGFPAPADGFFSDVDFKGAFNETNWIAGWTILAQSGLASSEGAGFNDFPVARVPATITIAPDGPGFVRMTVMTAVGASYQMQQSSDLVEWTDVGAAVVGDGMPHNERVATSDDIAFFRYVVE